MTETTPAGHATAAGTGLAASLACALGLAAVAVTLATTGQDGSAPAVTADVLGVVLPMTLGLFRLGQRSDDRFARLLVGAGLLWAGATLAQSTDSTAYSIGRVGAWVFELAVVYLLLAFPHGRVTTRVERAVVAAAGLVLVVLYLPTALLAEFPTPSPMATCGAHCPHNAFALTSSSPAFVDDFVRPLREVLTVLLWAAAAVLLVRRSWRSGPLVRHALVPVAGVATFRVVAIGLYFAVRHDDPTSQAAHTLGWVYLYSLPAIALCFAAGLLAQQLFAGTALERLTVELRPHPDAAALRKAMAAALEDPTLRIVYWLPNDPGQWIDETGWPVSAPTEEDGRAVTEITADGRRLAAIVHDVELSRDPELIRAASSYALTALDNERLVGQLRSSMRELSESRTRLVAVADDERRRIERDLHDGAQQRLVALRVKLDLAAERIRDESPDGADTIRRLEDDVDATIDEVRSFARGIYPSLLAERGLSEALRAAGRNASLPTVVHVAAVSRYRPEVEATVYFACME